MNIQILQLLIDFGLVILIWLVQLCIYPAFTYFKEEDLIKWHEAYTPRITFVVFPLMLSQLILSGYLIYNNFGLSNLINGVLVGLTWMTTFLIYVPLHQKIATENKVLFQSAKLVKLNWIRVFLWNLIFLTNAFFFLNS